MLGFWNLGDFVLGIFECGFAGPRGFGHTWDGRDGVQLGSGWG